MVHWSLCDILRDVNKLTIEHLTTTTIHCNAKKSPNSILSVTLGDLWPLKLFLAPAVLLHFQFTRRSTPMPLHNERYRRWCEWWRRRGKGGSHDQLIADTQWESDVRVSACWCGGSIPAAKLDQAPQNLCFGKVLIGQKEARHCARYHGDVWSANHGGIPELLSTWLNFFFFFLEMIGQLEVAKTGQDVSSVCSLIGILSLRQTIDYLKPPDAPVVHSWIRRPFVTFKIEPCIILYSQ